MALLSRFITRPTAVLRVSAILHKASCSSNQLVLPFFFGAFGLNYHSSPKTRHYFNTLKVFAENVIRLGFGAFSGRIVGHPDTMRAHTNHFRFAR